MRYRISQVLSPEGGYEAQYGKRRVSFKTEQTDTKVISAFTQYPDRIAVGREIEGDVTTKEQDGKVFYNFQFPKADKPAQREDSGGVGKIINILTFQVVPMLEQLTGRTPAPKRDVPMPDFGEKQSEQPPIEAYGEEYYPSEN